MGERSGLPCFRHSEEEDVEVFYSEGHWVIDEAGHSGQYPWYRQRFSPLSPAPRSAGWELGGIDGAPVPEVRPSWERELRMGGVVYRQEGAAGDGGRPRFRGKSQPDETVSWAAGAGGAGRWEWRNGTRAIFYNESAEQLPPRAVNRAAGPNTSTTR